MKKILLIGWFFVSITSFGQLRKDQLNAINARDIKAFGSYSSFKTGKLNDSTYLSLLGVKNNLSDLNSVSTARTNLGLTSLATTTPGTGITTWLTTPSSANLAAAITDETGGSGLLVFNSSPTIITPSFTTGFTIGGAATSRKIIVGNGTNFLASTETWAVPGTSGNLLTSDGTNWLSSAPTFWSLATGGTKTGVNTITGTTPSGTIFSETWTATANNNFSIRHTGTLTSRNTASDVLDGDVVDYTMNRNAGNPATQTANTFRINGTFGNSFATSNLFKVQNAGSDRLTLDASGNLFAGDTPMTPPSFTSRFTIGTNVSGAATFNGYFRNANSGGATIVYFDNDRGLSNYGGIYVGGSALAGTIFGLNKSDHVFFFAEGANNLGLAIGTTVAQPLSLGTNNVVGLSISSSQVITIPHYTTANGILYTDGLGVVSQSTVGSLPGLGSGWGSALTATYANITNSAANTQVMVSNGTNAIGYSTFTTNGTAFTLNGTTFQADKISSSSSTDFSIFAANASGANAKTVYLQSGQVISGNGNGGDIYLSAAQGSGSGNDGVIHFQAFISHSAQEELQIRGGASIGIIKLVGFNASGSIGESVNISGGNPTSGVTNGGDVILQGGGGNGGGLSGNVILQTLLKYTATNTTGGGTALLGANSPASTNTAPYTWFKVITSDGSTGYIPVWK